MTTVLNIYQAPSGQWSGRFIRDGIEQGRISGCDSAEQVQAEAGGDDVGMKFDAVVIERAERSVNDVLSIATRLEGIHDHLRIIDEMQAEALCCWDVNDSAGETSVMIERQIFLGATAARHLREFNELVQSLYRTQAIKH
jgi:hypothetical protein